jgi:tRNA(Ile)-lysidine synthase
LRKSDAVFSAAALAAVLFDEWRVPPGARLSVAYSGGLDSHALLHALAVLRVNFRFSLSAIHIDHGLQPASADWGRHCAQICMALNVPLIVERIRVDGIAEEGLEAAARRARYAAFAAALLPGDFLLTAHHGDDQAETVLLQLLRGAGVAGLAAMPAQAAFGPGRIVRPLLGFSRAALQAYAGAQQLDWIEDPSNRDLSQRRNFLRAEILPRLTRYWPAPSVLLARTAGHAAEAMDLLNEVAGADLVVCLHPVAHFPQALSISALAVLSVSRQRNLLRYWLRQQGFLVPGARQMEELLAQVRSVSRSRHACVRWAGADVWRYRDLLVAMPSQHSPDPCLDVAWDPRTALILPGIGRLRSEPVRGRGLSRARINGKPLHIRMRSGGERIVLPGRGHHHALKKLLQSEGVPPWLRTRLPLIYVDQELAAVADLWVCTPYQALPDEDALEIIWEPSVDAGSRPEKNS